MHFAATDHMGVVVALAAFGALCGFLLSGVSAFRQNRMEANMQNVVTKTEMQSMETNMQRMAATLQRIEQAITERDDENQGDYTLIFSFAVSEHPLRSGKHVVSVLVSPSLLASILH